MRAYVVGAEKRRPVLNILQRRRFCAAVNKEQEEITRDMLPASSRPYRPDAIPLCRCCASGRADRAAALYADTRFLFAQPVLQRKECMTGKTQRRVVQTERFKIIPCLHFSSFVKSSGRRVMRSSTSACFTTLYRCKRSKQT